MASLLLPIIYLAFISLGLPDALLGAAWPTMYPQLGAQVSWAGGVSMIISACTILSALASDRLNERLGTILKLAVVDHVVILWLMVEERIIHRHLRPALRADELEERTIAHLRLERGALLRVDALVDREIPLCMASGARNMDISRTGHRIQSFLHCL